MAEAKWAITYTRHVNQKRKVYHDGFLKHCGPNGKVVLTNERGEILESRPLKNGEVVESGGTVAFAAYLVDVGELEEESRPLSKLDVHVCSESPGRIGSNQKDLFDNHSAWCASNPIQTVGEWDVLYTTQITQRSKKYHDGFVRVVLRNSSQRQVLLYDDCGKFLCSRFMKKDEIVESGGALVFDSHLVEIGGLSGNWKCMSNFSEGQEAKPFEKNVLKNQILRESSSIAREASSSSEEMLDSSPVVFNAMNVTSHTMRDAKQILSFLRRPAAES